MIRSITKGSKLILIFILTVLVSGSILTYLSVNNIANFKELTEKKILEEQQNLAEEYSISFQKHLEVVTNEVLARSQSDASFNIQLFRDIDSMQGVHTPILIDSTGAFAWPHHIRITSSLRTHTSSKVYFEKLKKGEHLEFVKNDFKNAKFNYLKALESAINELDSVRIFNVLARLHTKINEPKKAFDLYLKIVEAYPETSNEYGFLYVNYSISQLIKLSTSSNLVQVQKVLKGYIENLNDGKVASNQYTIDVLKTIANWTTSTDERLDEMEYIKKLLIPSMNTLRVLSTYQNDIDKIVRQDITIKAFDSIGGFFVMNSNKESLHELFICKKTKHHFFGFVLNLNKLFDTVVYQTNEVAQTAFEYDIKHQPKEVNGYFSNRYLESTTEFSPYFKNHVLQISLQDKEVVNEYVFRRKMTYGIGLFLLLGAMIMGLIILIRDVKREKKMNRLRADFVSNVTHELKTPLTSIHMFAESILLGRVKSDKDLKKYANIIVKESQNLRRMITNILDFSRKENNKLAYNLKEVNVWSVVNSTLEEMNYWLEISNFKVVKELDEDAIAKVEVDGLKQALSNLISNAIKYSLNEKKIIVRLFKKENEVLIEVEDFGIGIPKDKLDLIFEKFYRVKSVENESASGTGLGLTVTRDIIEAQNGKLRVESTFGKGSKFTIVFTSLN